MKKKYKPTNFGKNLRFPYRIITFVDKPLVARLQAEATRSGHTLAGIVRDFIIDGLQSVERKD